MLCISSFFMQAFRFNLQSITFLGRDPGKKDKIKVFGVIGSTKEVGRGTSKVPLPIYSFNNNCPERIKVE